jgi:hypothetical protein
MGLTIGEKRKVNATAKLLKPLDEINTPRGLSASLLLAK